MCSKLLVFFVACLVLVHLYGPLGVDGRRLYQYEPKLIEAREFDLKPIKALNSNSTRLTERTFILIKPDGVQRALIGNILDRFESSRLTLVAMKIVWPTKELIEKHYGQHINRPFYRILIESMTSGPVVPMVWQGADAVRIGRSMLGKTEPEISMPGTIRGDFSNDAAHNIIHGSHSVKAANYEISLWFHSNEVI